MLGRSWRIGRLAGIDVRLDASWFLIAALLTWALAAGYFPDLLPGSDPIVRLGAAIVAMLGLFGSLILHELAHSLVARARGMKVRTITLFLFGGVAELAAEPPDAAAEARVAVAGPLASLALSAMAYILSVLVSAAGAAPAVVAVLVYLSVANLILAVFNMLPAFPLDGGRVLRSALWWRSGDLSAATRQASVVSKGFAYVMIVLGAVQVFGGAGAFGLWPVLLGLFILAAAQSARARVDVADALDGLSVAQVMRGDPVVTTPDASLQGVVDDVMLRHALSYVPVVEAGRLLGEIDLATVHGIDRDLWPSTRVDDVFLSFEPDDLVAPDQDAAALFDRMLREKRRKFPVVAGDRLLGLVTLSDLLARVRMSAELAAPLR